MAKELAVLPTSGSQEDIARALKYLDSHDCFASHLSMFFPKERLPRSFQGLPTLRVDMIGEYGINTAMVLEGENVKVLPATESLNGRGYAKWDIIPVAKGREISVQVGVSYVFNNICSADERRIVERAIKESHAHVFKELGYTEAQIREMLKDTSSYYSAIAFLKDPKVKCAFDLGDTRNRTVDEVIEILFREVDSEKRVLPLKTH